MILKGAYTLFSLPAPPLPPLRPLHSRALPSPSRCGVAGCAAAADTMRRRRPRASPRTVPCCEMATTKALLELEAAGAVPRRRGRFRGGGGGTGRDRGRATGARARAHRRR